MLEPDPLDDLGAASQAVPLANGGADPRGALPQLAVPEQLFDGAEIIGHRLCAAAFGKESPELMQQLRDGVIADPSLADFAAALRQYDFTGIRLTPPTTLIEDRLDKLGAHLDDMAATRKAAR